MSFERRFRLIVPLVGWFSVLLLVLVVLSPLALAQASRTKLDWARLSDVGQAYGGVSALLSALAFCAIAASLLLQWQQTRILGMAAVREQHFDLARMSIDNPSLTPLYVREAYGDDAARVGHSNLWVAHWLMLWELGMMADDRVVSSAIDLFMDPAARRWWEAVGSSWAVSGSRAEERFVALVTAGFGAAAKTAARSHGAALHRNTKGAGPLLSSMSREAVSFAFGAGLVTAVALARRRRRHRR